MRHIGDGATMDRAHVVMPGVIAMDAEREGMGVFATERRADGAFVGWHALKPLPTTDEIEVGYRLLPEHWGQGYATEGARALVKHGFETLGLERIVVIALPENTASLRVMEKVGMVDGGTIDYRGQRVTRRLIERSR